MEVNETKETEKRISRRELEADFTKPADRAELETQPGKRKTIRQPTQEQSEQAVQPQDTTAPLDPVSSGAPPPSPAQGLPHRQDTGKAERVMEHIDAAHTRQSSKKAVQRAQRETKTRAHSSRLQFTDEELATPELAPYIEKSNKAADRLDAAKAAIPKEKKLVKERTFDEATGKGKTRLRFEKQEKPMGDGKQHTNPLARPVQEAGLFVHNKIHSVEKDNSGVEGAHKAEELAEHTAKIGAQKIREGYRSHKLKPYRKAAKAEKAADKANINFQYHKVLHENPQAASNPLSRLYQKQHIKKQYAKAAKAGGAKAAKTAAESAKKASEATANTVSFVAQHWKAFAIAACALLFFIMMFTGLSSCSAIFSGGMNSILGTSYTSEDADLVAVEQAYCELENELQNQIDSIEQDYPGYDEYRYELDSISHDPHELASYLTAIFYSYTPADVQDELQRVFGKQYTLTLTEEVEVRYRTETRTTTSTDPETGETITEEYEVEVPYDYYILSVKLENRDISSFAGELLTDEQLEMFGVYLETKGNKPDVFGD